MARLTDDLFDFERRSLRFAVVGHPVAHSKSPRIHEAFARQFGLTLTYEAIDLDPIAFEQGVRHLQAGGVLGLNVTIPFKQAAYRLSDRLSDRARAAQAVNTLALLPDGTITGDNTDGAGLVQDLEVNLASRLRDAKVLILGAGGAARGILQPLLSAGPDYLAIANRTASRARDLAEEAGSSRVRGMAFGELTESFDLVINATSTSLTGVLPDVNEAIFKAGGLAYDLAYADQPTSFMRWAVVSGAGLAVDGLGMLVEQAAESFFIWHQKRPQTLPVIDELRAGFR